jgi:MFS transporter, DHA1 family, multidrug resistance protein
MGVNWAGTMLGCIAAVLVPIPILFYFQGHKIRARSKFAPTLPSAPPAELEEIRGE